MNKVRFATIKRDLDFVRGLSLGTSSFSSSGPLSPANSQPVVQVICRCGSPLEYFANMTDPPLSKLGCYGGTPTAFGLIWGCGREWTDATLKEMSDSEIEAVFFTEIPEDKDPPFKIVQNSNGVTKYHATRLMTADERHDYYFQALKELRKRR